MRPSVLSAVDSRGQGKPAGRVLHQLSTQRYSEPQTTQRRWNTDPLACGAGSCREAAELVKVAQAPAVM